MRRCHETNIRKKQWSGSLTLHNGFFLKKAMNRLRFRITDNLGGLTKGAIYHHFKSKEEIIDAVSDRMFFANNPFEAVRGRKDLNGLQKLRETIRLNQSDRERTNLTIQSIPICKNPRLLIQMISSNRKILTPYYQELLEEGNRDGSIHTKYAKEIAELMPLLTSLWMLPSVFPGSKEDTKHKFLFIGEMLEKMGVPLFDQEILQIVDDFFDQLPEIPQKE